MKPIEQQLLGKRKLLQYKQRPVNANSSGTNFGVLANCESPDKENQLLDIESGKAVGFSKTHTILVMDDEVSVRELIAKILGQNKCNVALAGEGSEAVYLYKTAKNSDRCYDAVILDLSVPGGMGGGEAMQQLRLIDPEVKCILSSGYSADPMVTNFREYGFSAMLSKPFKIDDLISVVKQVIT